MKALLHKLVGCALVGVMATLIVYLLGAFVSLDMTWMSPVVARLIFAGFFSVRLLSEGMMP